MQDYINNKCPICNKVFTEKDDIVVCPECGTPHHRECYKNNAGCANEYQHGEFEWKSDNNTPGNSVTGVICQNCGSENPSGNRYCAQCGTPLNANGAQKEPKISFTFMPESDYLKEKQQTIDNILNNEEFDGISAKEAALTIKTNINYFLVRFLGIAKGRKLDTNISAFLFTYFYAFYRKMYALGTVALIANAILCLPSFLIEFQSIQEAYVKAGLLSQVVWNVPHLDLLNKYSFVAWVLLWIIRILFMLFFNRLYYNHVTGTVKNIKEKLTDSEDCIVEQLYIDTLRRKGGTSMLIPVIIIAANLLISIAIACFLVSSPYFIFPTA